MSDLRVSFPKPCAENWDQMARAGRNRFCGTCSKTIYDLSQHSLAEVEALLDADHDPCVRARIESCGEVRLRSEAKRNGRRLMAATGVAMSVIATSSLLAAETGRTAGAICGRVNGDCQPVSVSAVGSDGKRYPAKVKPNGEFKVKNVPFGTYRLEFSSAGQTWLGDEVAVQSKKASAGLAPRGPEQEDCYIVGVMSRWR